MPKWLPIALLALGGMILIAFSAAFLLNDAGADDSTTEAGAATTAVVDETVEGFVATFGEALANGDVAYVVARLHPLMVEAFGENVCRTWIAREIMGLTTYELVSVDGGPRSQSYAFPGGEGELDAVFDATVTFTYQGEERTNSTSFALVDGEMHWLGECR